MNFTLTNVGIAEIGIAKTPDILRTILGSCVGICLYDLELKIGGLAHIMLPEQKMKSSSPKKYADSAIPLLIEEMLQAGARRKMINAKILGGAKMFNLPGKSLMSDIGLNNIKKVKEILEELAIPIKAEDVGGDYGRTIDFFTDSGQIKIKSLGKGEKYI